MSEDGLFTPLSGGDSLKCLGTDRSEDQRRPREQVCPSGHVPQPHSQPFCSSSLHGSSQGSSVPREEQGLAWVMPGFKPGSITANQGVLTLTNLCEPASVLPPLIGDEAYSRGMEAEHDTNLSTEWTAAFHPRQLSCLLLPVPQASPELSSLLHPEENLNSRITSLHPPPQTHTHSLVSVSVKMNPTLN